MRVCSWCKLTVSKHVCGFISLYQVKENSETNQMQTLNPLILPLTLESASKSILLDHTISSTLVATCRSSNCRIAFDDVIVRNLPKRDALKCVLMQQIEIKLGGCICPVCTRPAILNSKIHYTLRTLNRSFN